jgi:NAD(P)-dependent dehydrogenase (short-subunit alcohol dehydrogenase family)
MTPTRLAVVTGASRGIGREIARRLLEKGLEVVLAARAPEAAAADLGAVPFRLDVTRAEDAELLRAFLEERGRLDVLVNNAAVYPRGRGVDVDLEEVRATLETNLFGPWRLCQLAIPLMRRGGYGRIVNVSSGGGSLAEMGGGFPGYRVSKAGLNALTRILADELHGENILVNAVDPGWVRTEMGGPDAPRSVEQGADTAVWLATLPDGGPTGGFFFDRRPTPW